MLAYFLHSTGHLVHVHVGHFVAIEALLRKTRMILIVLRFLQSIVIFIMIIRIIHEVVSTKINGNINMGIMPLGREPTEESVVFSYLVNYTVALLFVSCSEFVPVDDY